MIQEHEYFKIGFLKTLWLIREYLSEVVIGGGWVPLIYYHYLLGSKSKYPILTKDIDIIVKEKIPVIGSKTLDELLTDAGLKTIFKSLDPTLPVVHYEGAIDNYETEIEFLTNLKGLGDKDVIEVQKGLHAKALRFISILTENVMEITIDDFSLIDQSRVLNIRVPSPAAFLFHKGVTFVRRNESKKKEKDLYYMFDVLVNCSELEGEIDEGLKILKSNYSSWFKSFIKNLIGYFADDTSDGIKFVHSQKPKGDFPEMNDEQFKLYVFNIFNSFIRKIKSY